MNIKCENDYFSLAPHIQDKIDRANVFYGEKYRNYMSSYSDLLYIYNDQLLIMVNLIGKLIFRYAQFPCEPISIAEDVSREHEAEFLDKCLDLLHRQHKVQWLTITPASSFFRSFPQNSFRIPFGSYVIDLRQTEENIFARSHSKNRTNVRRAEKAEVVIRYGHSELLDDFLMLEKETWARSDKNTDNFCYYRDILAALKDDMIIFIAYKEDVPQGGAIYYFNQVMCYCMYAASKSKPETGSMNLLHWEAIKYMKNKGVAQYSLVGARINEDANSKYEDLQRFKMRLGGELKRGYLFKTVFNPYCFNLFNSLIRFRNKAIEPDIIDQEIRKWPELQMND